MTINDPYNRPISNIVTYPVCYVRAVHLSQLKLYNLAMQETLQYIKRPILSQSSINIAPFNYYEDEYPVVINELRKTFIVGLFHLWFQELQEFLIEGGDAVNTKKHKIETTSASCILDLFHDENDMIQVISILKKYACLTNAIKHGRGNSLKKLIREYKEFFYPSKEYTIIDDDNCIREWAKEPLVTQEHIEELYYGVIEFWNRLPKYVTIDFDKLYSSKI